MSEKSWEPELCSWYWVYHWRVCIKWLSSQGYSLTISP